MRRILAILLMLLLSPAVVFAQQRAPLSAEQSAPATQASQQDAWLVPVWQSRNGHWMAALPNDSRLLRAPLKVASEDNTALVGDVLSLGGDQTSAALTVDAGSRLYSTLRINSVSAPAVRNCRESAASSSAICMRARQPSWRGGALSGGYRGNSVLIDLGMDWMRHDQRVGGLLLVVPNTEHASLMGIPSQWIDSLDRIRASGSMQLGDSGTHLDMGASVGRMRLLPNHARLPGGEGLGVLSGYTPGMDSIDQKSLSIGVGRGAISGSIVGRVMQPDGPGRTGNNGLMQQWSAVDLGITVRLPWEGELSLGAQNLWSSGDRNKLPNPDRDSAQSRIPYIQYHQEL